MCESRIPCGTFLTRRCKLKSLPGKSYCARHSPEARARRGRQITDKVNHMLAVAERANKHNRLMAAWDNPAALQARLAELEVPAQPMSPAELAELETWAGHPILTEAQAHEVRRRRLNEAAVREILEET